MTENRSKIVRVSGRVFLEVWDIEDYCAYVKPEAIEAVDALSPDPDEDENNQAVYVLASGETICARESTTELFELWTEALKSR